MSCPQRCLAFVALIALNPIFGWSAGRAIQRPDTVPGTNGSDVSRGFRRSGSDICHTIFTFRVFYFHMTFVTSGKSEGLGILPPFVTCYLEVENGDGREQGPRAVAL